LYNGKLENWRVEVGRLALRTRLRYWRGGYPESMHRLRAELVRNSPAQMQMAVFSMGREGRGKSEGQVHTLENRNQEWPGRGSGSEVIELFCCILRWGVQDTYFSMFRARRYLALISLMM